MAALSKKGVNEIITALRELGGKTTLAKLAEKLGRDVNGLSQTLSNNKKLIGLIEQDDGKGGARIVGLSAEGQSFGPLFSKKPG